MSLTHRSDPRLETQRLELFLVMGFVLNPSKNLPLHCCHLSLLQQSGRACVTLCHPFVTLCHPLSSPLLFESQLCTQCITCHNFLHTSNAKLKISSFAIYPSSMFRSQVMFVYFKFIFYPVQSITIQTFLSMLHSELI